MDPALLYWIHIDKYSTYHGGLINVPYRVEVDTEVDTHRLIYKEGLVNMAGSFFSKRNLIF